MVGRRYIVYFFSLVLLFFLAACGQKVRNSLSPIQTSSRVPVTDTSLVLLPLADYSTGFRPDDAMRRQSRVQQALTYYLAQKGYYLPMQEDVVGYLADLNVIRLSKSSDSPYKAANDVIYKELGNGWSDEIVKIVTGVVQRNDRMAEEGKPDMSFTGITPDVLQKISERFGANYVLRGRISEYEIRDDSVLNPVRQGIIPFFFDFSSKTFLGFTESRDYDAWQDMALAAGAGSWMANSSNAVLGGFLGGGSGYLISKGGKEPVAVVRIGLAMQEPDTGRVVWANWVEKQVWPSSVWAGQSYREQLDKALDEAAYELIDDLSGTLSSMPAVKVTQVAEPAEPQIQAPVAEPQKAVTPAPPEPIEEEPVLLAPKDKTQPESWGS